MKQASKQQGQARCKTAKEMQLSGNHQKYDLDTEN